jgi:hypothetical protein
VQVALRQAEIFATFPAVLAVLVLRPTTAEAVRQVALLEMAVLVAQV